MPAELVALYNDIDLDQLRIRRPTRFIFFCGGAIAPDGQSARSLRCSLLRDKKIDRRLKAEIVLAEQANQIYRDTDYPDLISFEEDIARIAAMVLVIAESPGSLAELGAFATNDTIRPALSILMQTNYYEAESFVRFGPVERIQNDDNERVGVFPWRLNGKGVIVKASVNQHVAAIVNFINSKLGKVPNDELYRTGEHLRNFLLLYWVLSLATALSITELQEYANNLHLPFDVKEVKRKLYCMKMAGWVGSYTYSNKTYWYVRRSEDCFSRYSFKPSVAG